jgi:hypothetical protein
LSTVWHDDEIDFLLRAVGAVAVTIDGVAGIGTLDWNDELQAGDQLRGQVIVGVPMLTVRSSAFPMVHVDSAVSVDGKLYSVRERLKYGDGGTTKLFLGTSSSTVPFPPPDIIDGGDFDGTGGIGRSADGGSF